MHTYTKVPLSKQSSNPRLRQSRSNQYGDILGQVDALDRQNKQLLCIADNIMKTSFLSHYDQTPAVVSQLEQDMKTSFNQLIESIRQFFMSIDSKVKELGQIIQSKIEGESQKIAFPSVPDSHKIDNLVTRIAFMEENIKRSQENQAKLISIIEEMNNKRLEEQPTIRKENQRDSPFNNCKTMNNSNSTGEQNSFRLFSMGGPQEKKGITFTERKEQSRPHPAYHRFQQYSNSPVVESIDPSHRKGRETPSYFCGGAPLPDSKSPPKHINYLKQSTNQFQAQSSNRIHRLSNLLKALKE